MLQRSWVDSIFDKLTLTYGQSFLRRWQDVDMERVKADWGHELAGLEQSPKSIAYALQNLPADTPPTVLQFRKIAWSMPAADMPQIEHTPASKRVIAKVLAGLAPVTDNPHGMKAWAHRMKARHDAGDRLNLYQIKCYQSAMGIAA